MYKVLRKEDEKLVSCVVGNPEVFQLKDWQITYTPNEWIKAKIGKVIVCKTLGDAKIVLHAEDAHEIWRCQTKKAVHLSRLACPKKGLVEEFWKGVSLNWLDLLTPYFSTYGADTIKITKKVWPKEK